MSGTFYVNRLLLDEAERQVRIWRLLAASSTCINLFAIVAMALLLLTP